MTGHQNKYNNNEEIWNIVRITKMWSRDMKWVNASGKMVLTDLLIIGLPQTLSLL